VDPLELKGKSTPVRAWRLVAAVAGDGSLTPGGPVEAPFVAREAELSRLNDALEEVIALRACRLVTVIGSPGLGKSRLAVEFAARVGDRATVVHGHCEPTGEGNTFLPVAEVIRELAA